MIIEGKAKLLRIFLGESDKIGSVTLHEKIVLKAKEAGLAGATCYKGIMGFGRSSRIHTSKVFRLSEDLPVVIEIVDEEKKIEEFLPAIDKIFEESDAGGLITLEHVEIIKYTSANVK